MEFIEIFTYCGILLVARYAFSLLKENKLVDMIDSFLICIWDGARQNTKAKLRKLLKLSLYLSATVQPFFAGNQRIGIRVLRKTI